MVHEPDNSPGAPGETLVMKLLEEFKTDIDLTKEENEWNNIKKDASEIRDQHPHFENVIKKLGLTNTMFQLRHEVTLDSEKKPDYIFIKDTASYKTNLIYASFVVELQVKTINDEHIGKMLRYNEEVLYCNPARQFVISVLTNLEDIILIKSQPGPNKNGQFDDDIIHYVSKYINFWKHGVKYIKQMHSLPEMVGYDEQKNFSIKVSFGFYFV